MATYAASQPVEFTATLRNRSSSPCLYNGYSVEFTFKDAAGEAWGGGNVDAAPLGDVRLAPGQALVHSAPWRHSLSPPGTYSASVRWTFAGHAYARSVAFTLT
jgi:hypothetical protein